MIHKFSRYLLTLVALFAMTTGAWAEEVTIGDGTGATYYFPIDDYFNYSCTEEIYTADEIGTKGTINAISFYYNYGTPYEASNVKMFMKHVTRSVFKSNTDYEPLSETDLVWTGSIAPTKEGWFTFTLDTPFEYNGTDNLLVAFYDGTSGYPGQSYTWRQTTSPNKAYMALRYYSDSYNPDPYNLSNYPGGRVLYDYRANIKLDIESISVEINDAKTTASFEMPGSDVTVSYELVRDMTVDVDATIADRIRIKKENNVYVVVTDGQLTPAVSDKISGTAVAMTVTTDYTVKLQKKVEGDTPSWTDATALSVGTFRYVITGANLYDGEITTNEFQLFEGYELTVAKGEYATFYCAEAVYADEDTSSAAELYTISSVTDTEAVLSDKIETAPAETPLIVYNSSDEDMKFILIPTTAEPDVLLTVADQFKGTLEAKEFSADMMDDADYYVCTGKQFVWVKSAGTIGANRCWLEFSMTSQPASSRAVSRSIVHGGDATKITNTDRTDLTDGDLYDLNGRKVLNPTKKGIYIKNGRKVVIK